MSTVALLVGGEGVGILYEPLEIYLEVFPKYLQRSFPEGKNFSEFPGRISSRCGDATNISTFL